MRNLILILLFVQLPALALSWQACDADPFHLWQDDEPHMQCALLEVPLAYHPDHRRARLNDTRTISLALSRIPASGKRLGSLIFVSGGPGESGILPWPYDNPATRTLRKHFDLIFYDPRGIGYSTPRIQCHAHGEPQPDTARDFVAACERHTDPNFLPHIGSHEATNDLDRIRQALGDEHINLVAYSYGTKIAALYALRFPEHVRAIVFDGIVNPFEHDYNTRLHQEKSHQHSFERYLAQCTRAPYCPFGQNSGSANTLLPLITWSETLAARKPAWPIQLYDHLADQLGLQRHTLPAPDETTLVNAFYNTLPWPESWSFLSDSLLFFAHGDSGYINYLGTNLNEYDHDTLTAITCADVARPMPDGENQILQRHIDLQSAYDNHHLKTRNDLIDPCGLWPYIGGDHQHPLPAKPPTTLPPLLLIAQRHDPSTPWHNARHMADYWQSPLITRDSDGHTLVFSDTSPCINQIASDYLLNPDTPRQDSVCTD